MEEKKWFVYLIKCLDGSFYTGVTLDLEKRIVSHKCGKGSKYIRAKGFDCLVGSRECFGKSRALKEEVRIKKLNHKRKMEEFEN